MYTSFRCLKLERAELIRDISGINTKINSVSQKASLYFNRFAEDHKKIEKSPFGNMKPITYKGKFGNEPLAQKVDMEQFGLPPSEIRENDLERRLRNELGPKYAEYK